MPVVATKLDSCAAYSAGELLKSGNQDYSELGRLDAEVILDYIYVGSLFAC